MSEIIWSPSKLKVAENCMAQYFYTYLQPNRPKLPSTGRMAMGTLFHKLMEEFWKEDGTTKYKSAESFTNVAINRWRFLLRNNKSRGSEIIWGFPNEKWVLLNKDVPETATVIYSHYSEREKPIVQEHEFKVEIDGVKYRGFIDAVFPFDEKLKKVRIADWKTSRGVPAQSKLERDHQFVAYHLVMGFELKHNLELRRKVGMPDELADWVGEC